MNAANSRLEKLMKKLESYYQKSLSYRKPRAYGSLQRTAFRMEIPQHKLDKTKKERVHLSKHELSGFENEFEEMIKVYEEIIKATQDIEVYCRLEDYDFDNFAYSDSMLNVIRQKFEKHAALNNTIAGALSGLWRNAYKNSKNSYVRAALVMDSILQYERKVHQGWAYNLSYKTFTQNIPWKKLTNSYATYFSRHYPDFSSLKHPASFYYNRFIHSTYQNQKPYMIDEYNREKRENDGHSNFVYRTLINYYNHELVSEFNSYVYSLSGKNIYIGYAIGSTPVFKIDTLAVPYQPETVHFSDTIAGKVSVFTEKAQTPQKKQIQAVNACIEFVNEEIRHSNWFVEHIVRYNHKINKFIKGELKYGTGTFAAFDSYKLPYSLYFKAKGLSVYLPDDIATFSLETLDKLKEIAKEREQLIYALHRYSVDDEYEKDKGAMAYEMFRRFEFLYVQFDKHTTNLYKGLNRYYLSFAEKPDNAWCKSSHILSDIVREDRRLVNAVDAKFADNHYKMPSITTIRELSRQCVSEMYDNLKGLDKFGRYHGYCPYSPYEDIATESIEFVKDILEIENDIANARDLADAQHDYIRKFNDIVEEYNRFAKLACGDYEEYSSHSVARYFLLKTVKHPFIFRFVPTEEYIPVTEPTKQLTETGDSVFTSMDGYAENNLVLLLDVSGSMNEKNKLPLLQESFSRLLTIMRPEDKVAVVVYSGKAEEVLSSLSCRYADSIRNVLESLRPAGKTDIDKGISVAYRTAYNGFIPKGNNRIILATDGQFDIKRKTLKKIEKGSSDNVFLSVFSFSTSTGKQEKLEQIATTGKGVFYKILPSNINRTLVKEVQAIKNN